MSTPAKPGKPYISNGQVLERYGLPAGFPPIVAQKPHLSAVPSQRIVGQFTANDILCSPPLTTRIIRWIDDVYFFFGLYFVTLFSVSSISGGEFRTAYLSCLVL